MKNCKKVLLFLILGMFLFACQEMQSKKTANLVYPNWAEGVAYTHLIKAVLEDMMDYEVKITSSDLPSAFASIAEGSQDAFTDVWLPIHHKEYVDKYKDKIEDLGVIYEGSQGGLVVPKYVSIDKISQLNEYADKLGNQIVGIEEGSNLNKFTEKVRKAYGIKLKLLVSSDPAMSAALGKAINKGKWIVVASWTPHWMFGRWDLKFLKQDDDKKIWGTEQIHIMGRKNLSQEKPELAKFLGRVKLSDEKLTSLMYEINTHSDKDIMDVVKTWIENNKEYVKAWVVE